MTYRELEIGETIQEGDEYADRDGAIWDRSTAIGKLVTGPFLRYRRPVAAESGIALILAKQAEHIAQIEANNTGRDRALALGQELVSLRKQFAEQQPDRVFISGALIVETTGGLWSTRTGEVVL